MAAKGAKRKKEIMEKILEVFPGSFLYNDGKEVRINGTEDGVPVQIKVTLTAAKTPVEGGSESVTSAPAASNEINFTEEIPQEPTEEEKERLAYLLDKLGL